MKPSEKGIQEARRAHIKRQIPDYNSDLAWREALEAFIAIDVDPLLEQLKCARDIEASFWRALKLLNLESLNVADPGSHFTERLNKKDAEILRLMQRLGPAVEEACAVHRAAIAALEAENASLKHDLAVEHGDELP